MLNRVILQGRLCSDPELRYTQSQTPVTTFTLAVDRDYSGGEGGRQTDFIDCCAWRKTAEFAERYFRKGSLAVVSGRLQIRDYKDREGNARRATEVNVDSLYFGESRRSAESEPPGHPISPASRPVNVTPPFEDLGDDDTGSLPF